MDPKAPNFTAYDFLGYFFPGAAAVLCADASIAFHASPYGLTYEALLTRYSNKEIGIALPFVIVSYIAGHFLSFVSSVSLERYAIWMYGHPSKYLLGMDVGGYFAVSGSNRTLSFLLRALMWILILPVSSLDLLFGYIMRLRANYVTPLDPLLRTAVWQSLNFVVSHCGIEKPKELGKPKDHEFWKLAVHYAVDRAPNHGMSLRNYVVLYGFLRTTALVFVMLFWAVAAHMFLLRLEAWTIGIVLFIGAFVCFASFVSFMKFFQRYHEEALLAVTVAVAREKKQE